MMWTRLRRTSLVRTLGANALALCLVVLGSSGASSAKDTARLVTLHGAVTETVFALGVGEQVVAVDTTSAYPASVHRLPKLGFYKMVSAEGIASHQPTQVIAWEESGPSAAFAQLRKLGVQVVTVTSEESKAGTVKRIAAIARAVGRQAKGEELVGQLESDFAKLAKQNAAWSAEGHKAKPRVLFLYARGAGNLLAAGKNTGAHEMIRMAGGVNAVQAMDGFKPVTAEALVTAKPDVVLVSNRGLRLMGGEDALFSTPGLNLTPAGRNRRVITMDGSLLLGFGPRLGQAVLSLAEKFQALTREEPKT